SLYRHSVTTVLPQKCQSAGRLDGDVTSIERGRQFPASGVIVPSTVASLSDVNVDKLCEIFAVVCANPRTSSREGSDQSVPFPMPGTVSGPVVFKTTAIDHSAIPPRQFVSKFSTLRRTFARLCVLGAVTP